MIGEPDVVVNCVRLTSYPRPNDSVSDNGVLYITPPAKVSDKYEAVDVLLTSVWLMIKFVVFHNEII